MTNPDVLLAEAVAAVAATDMAELVREQRAIGYQRAIADLAAKYADRLDAEADRVAAIPKTGHHGKTYNAGTATGLIAAARMLREWADEELPWPDPEQQGETQ